MKNLLKISSIAITFCITGCAGNPEYGCGIFPETGCQPVSKVFDKSNEGKLKDYRDDLYSKDSKKIKAKKYGNVNNKIVDKNLKAGDPLFTKPEILRIYINSWVDNENDFNAGGTIYIKLKDGKWVTNH